MIGVFLILFTYTAILSRNEVYDSSYTIRPVGSVLRSDATLPSNCLGPNAVFPSKLSVCRAPTCPHSPSIRFTSRVLLLLFQVLSPSRSVGLSLSTPVTFPPLSLIAAGACFLDYLPSRPPRYRLPLLQSNRSLFPLFLITSSALRSLVRISPYRLHL